MRASRTCSKPRAWRRSEMEKILLPSREQFKRWSLPSKYSFYGLILGLLSLVITIVYDSSIPKSPEQMLESAAQELRNNYLCLELMVQKESGEIGCQYKLIETKQYLANSGDWEITRLTYSDHDTFEYIINKLNRCTGDIKELTLEGYLCRDLTLFDIYYLTRYAHWLSIPLQNDLLGTQFDIVRHDIEQDLYQFFPRGLTTSKNGNSFQGQPKSFSDRLD